ncbi:MAG: IS110 family transposase [Bacteroidales bacterium]|nr:IS110 family transposase [Bacteroidales bacterium]
MFIITLNKGDSKLYLNINKHIIKSINTEIEKTEKEIDTIIKTDDKIKNNYKILKTVPGIGKITAFYLIAYMHNFTKLVTARKFCYYCGIAPFENTSEISVKGRTKVNPLASKMIKALLNMGAMSAIQIIKSLKHTIIIALIKETVK